MPRKSVGKSIFRKCVSEESVSEEYVSGESVSRKTVSWKSARVSRVRESVSREVCDLDDMCVTDLLVSTIFHQKKNGVPACRVCSPEITLFFLSKKGYPEQRRGVSREQPLRLSLSLFLSLSLSCAGCSLLRARARRRFSVLVFLLFCFQTFKAKKPHLFRDLENHRYVRGSVLPGSAAASNRRPRFVIPLVFENGRDGGWLWTIERVLKRHGTCESVEKSKVQIGLETTEFRVENEIAPVVG